MSDIVMTDLQRALREAAVLIDEHAKHPHGPPVTGDARTAAGAACVDLRGGDQDTARTLWKLIVEDLGYMPHAAAVALAWAATANLIPDIEPPDLDGPRGPAADGKVIS